MESKMDAEIEKVYYNLSNPASFSTAEKIHKELLKKIPLAYIKQWLSAQLAYTLHKPIKKKFKRNSYNLDNINTQLQLDLMDVSNLAKENDNNRFVLFAIDAFSRYVYTRPLKTKSAVHVLEAFKSIIESLEKPPSYIVSDRGKEFCNNQLSAYLASHTPKIHHYSPSNDTFKASIAERGIRTFKEILFKMLTAKLSLRYIDDLQNLTTSMNKRFHRTIGCAPCDVNDKNILKVWTYIQSQRIKSEKFKPRRRQVKKYPIKIDLKVGDTVRISKNKSTTFDKGYLPNWSDDLYTITRVVQRNPPIFNIKDKEDGEIVEGAFYREELQKVSDETMHRIEKILRKRTRRGIREVEVLWKGSKKKTSWIPESELVNNESGSESTDDNDS
jgi:Integrase core domain